jgi:hypothetical protein
MATAAATVVSVDELTHTAVLPPTETAGRQSHYRPIPPTHVFQQAKGAW